MPIRKERLSVEHNMINKFLISLCSLSMEILYIHHIYTTVDTGTWHTVCCDISHLLLKIFLGWVIRKELLLSNPIQIESSHWGWFSKNKNLAENIEIMSEGSKYIQY